MSENKLLSFKRLEYSQIVLHVMRASGLIPRGLNIDFKTYLLASGF